MNNEPERRGWKLANISAGEHLKRVLDMYKELGIEVETEEISAEQCGDCCVCFADGKQTIYRVWVKDETPAGV